MNKILNLQEKRACIWEQAKKFLDEKQKESDTLSAEDTATHEQMENDVARPYVFNYNNRTFSTYRFGRYSPHFLPVR